MKQHFPLLIKDLHDDHTHLDYRYHSADKHILRWCAVNKIVISRIQLETVALNAPVFLSEANRLGLASDPSLASVPQPTQNEPDTIDLRSPSYSPMPSDEEGA